jgi:hypothetical protein
VFIGWDWATETHDVTVMDETGKRIDRWELAQTEEGFAATLARLRVMWACWRDGTCYDPATHQASGKIDTTAEAPLAA